MTPTRTRTGKGQRDRTGYWLTSPRHGPLPALLLVLTVATGVVDAVSILALGRVFVANMTGNVVFIGFAIAGAPGFSLSASLLALAGFLVGAAGGAPLIHRWAPARGRLLAVVTTVEVVLLTVVLGIALASDEPFGAAPRNLIAVVAATALGLQNATARELAVPDATTTVLTMTLTGLAADLRRGDLPVVLRRLCAVGAMLAGALSGGVLVLQASATAALGLALGLVAVVCLGAWTVGRRPGAWQKPALEPAPEAGRGLGSAVSGHRSHRRPRREHCWSSTSLGKAEPGVRGFRRHLHQPHLRPMDPAPPCSARRERGRS